MAFALSNVFQFQCPNPRFSPQINTYISNPKLPTSLISFSRKYSSSKWVVSAASSAAGSSSSDNDLNPYEVLGVSSIEGFEKVKAAYTKKHKDAERRGDEATAARLEKAYDKVMMEQLTKRKKGITFGSVKVSKDIKYADKQPIIPWGPRFSKSDARDIQVNLVIAAAAAYWRRMNFLSYSAICISATAWAFFKASGDWMAVQLLGIAFVYRIFTKLSSSEASVSPTFNEEGEDEGRMSRMGKRLLRSLALVFGCIAVVSLGYTGIINIIEISLGFVPAVLYNQELFVTAGSAFGLYTLASFYR